MIKFESCPGLRKTAPQEISVHNMIAYKDAFRVNISLGDKVLAPWQDDGRYGPGTVLDGYERRNTQYEGRYFFTCFITAFFSMLQLTTSYTSKAHS